MFNPFPGLRPFSAEEDYLFFGREDQTNELLELLREHRFIAVVGTSGSGKSSLVRAGLLPALFGGTMVSVGSRWEVGVFRPGGDPIRNLAQSLVDCDLYDGGDPETLPRIMATLRRSRNGLVEAIRQSDLGERHNLLLVVDQFEELFRFSADRPEHQELASEFAQLLLTAASSKDIPIYIALTMRSDYLGECAQLPGLAEAVNHGEYLIPRLTRDQRRDAIERPIAVGGGKISGRLINQLLNEVGDDVDQLPVLQHALMRIWDCWEEDHRDDEPIDLRHYEAVGGLSQALSKHADEVFRDLGDPKSQLLCERVFKALTERGNDERGIRRPTPMADLCKIAEGATEEVRDVLDAFRKVGRTFVMPLEETAIEASTIIDISHESLMRVWTRLRNWVDEESQSARVYRRLAETASLFNDQRAGHYRDPDLSIAWAWREHHSPNRDWADRYAPGFDEAIRFLEESKAAATAEERERELRRQRELEQAQRLAEAQRKARRRSQGLTLCAIVAAVVIGVFWNSASVARREAEEARGQAEQQRDAAETAAEMQRIAKEAEAAQRTIAEREAQQNRLGLYAASIRQAERELSRGASRNAGLDQLDQWNRATSIDGSPDTPAIRDWEWYYLKGKAKSLDLDPRIETLKLGSRVNFAGRWSPDGERLALTGLGQQVLVLDGKTREIVQMFERKGVGFSPRIAWSPDGESIAIDNWSGPVEIYDLHTGMLTQILNHNGGNTNSTLSWNHTHNLIAYSLDQGKVGIYDMTQRRLVNVIPTSSELQAIEWSPDGSQLAFSTTPGGLHILDYPSMEVSYKLGTRIAYRLRWTPDGKQLICQDARLSQLFVVTPETNEHTPSVESGVGGIWGMAMHPQQPWVALSGPRGEIGIFDYRQQALVDSLTGFSGMMVGVDWRPQGDLLFISGLTQGETMLVDLSKRRQPVIETGIDITADEILGGLLNCKLAPDGKRVALSSDVAGRLLVAEFDSNQLTSNIDTPLADLVSSFDWSPNGELLAVADQQTLLVLNAQNPAEIQASYSLEEIGGLASLEWSSCGNYLAFTQGRNAKSTWGVLQYEDSTLNLFQLEGLDRLPRAIAWHPHHPKLAVGLRQNSRSGGPIQLWDVSKRSLELTIPSVDTNVHGLSFSHHGDRLAVIFDRPAGIFSFESSGAIEIFSSADGRSLVQFPPQSVSLTDVTWNTTDQRLATSSFDGNVRVWRADGTELLTFTPFDSLPVNRVFWDENGGRLIACALHNSMLGSWSIEDSLDDVNLNGSPDLLGNLLAKGGIDPLKTANLYASSGQFDQAADILDQLSEATPTATIFSSNYWRLREYPEALNQLANGELSTIEPAKLEPLLEPIVTDLWKHPELLSDAWNYVGRDKSRLNLNDFSTDELSRLQVIATRYYSDRPTRAALVLGGGENVIAWHNNKLVIDHRQPGLVSNGEMGAILDLTEGWNDLVFVVYSDSQQLQLEPYLLDHPSRILANSLVTWDGPTPDSFEKIAEELDYSPQTAGAVQYQLETMAGRWNAATATLEELDGSAHSKFVSHAINLGERGKFEQAANYAQRIYDDFPMPYTESLLGETLAKSNGVSLVHSDAEWNLFVSTRVGGDLNIVDLFKETKLDQHPGLWHQKLEPGSLRRWVGNSGFTRSLPHHGNKEVLLLQTSFDTDIPLESLLFEIDSPEGFIVYLDGEECYRTNVVGVDKFNIRGQRNSPDHDVNYARRSIPLLKSLPPGKHSLAVSVHQDTRWDELWVRCPTLTGFSNPPPPLPAGTTPGVELAFQLSIAATRGHFDQDRVEALLDAGVDPLSIEDHARSIYAILESSQTLDESERLVLGKMLSEAKIPARSFNISLAIAPTLRLGDDEKMEELLSTWRHSAPHDSRLLAADLLSKIRQGPDVYEKARELFFASEDRNRLNNHQLLLICVLALTPLSEEQHNLLSQWKAELSLWTERSQDSALDRLTSALLDLQTDTIDETTTKWLSRIEQAETQSPANRYLASAILDQAMGKVGEQPSGERIELKRELETMLQLQMSKRDNLPFTLEQWLKYRVAKGLAN